MRVFESREVVDRMGLRVEMQTSALERAALLREWAWYLRQSDPPKAERLIAQAERLDAATAGPTPLAWARDELVRLTRMWLEGLEPSFSTRLDAVQALAETQGDWAMAADVEVLRGLAAGALGYEKERTQHLEASSALARRAGDPERAALAQWVRLGIEAIAQPDAVFQRWGAEWAQAMPEAPPAVRAWLENFKAVVDYGKGDMKAAVLGFQRAFMGLLETGQDRAAIVTAGNVSDALFQLHDHDAGLEWAQRSLALGRTKGWPMELGVGLMRVGEHLRNIGHFELARSMLEEALQVLAPLDRSRTHDISLAALAEAYLAQGDYEQALERFSALAQRPQGGQQDVVLRALFGAARAFAAQGAWAQALGEADRALELGQRLGVTVRELPLRVLRARALHGLGDFEGSLAAAREAMARARATQGPALSEEVWADGAKLFAMAGDHQMAYEALMEAAEARRRTHTQKVQSRAIALEVRLETERTQAEAERERERAKLAALSALVAGVAHELNTPIGNCVLVASGLSERVTQLQRDIETGTLKRSTLSEFLGSTQQAADLLGRGLETAADLVRSFKEVAVQRAHARRQTFDLRALVLDVVAPLQEALAAGGHRVAVNIEPGLQVEGYPGPLGEVLTELLGNALRHAFPGERSGLVHISALDNRDGRALSLQVCDDGVGIPEQNLQRVFEPFFTTRLGSGRNGLGLAIAYNIATNLLGANLVAQSTPGQGTCFALTLPRHIAEAP